jgi:hypothetical protein
MLAAPVLGYWEYDGTSVTIGGPGSGSGSDPYATWGWSAYAWGDVDYDVTYLETSGHAVGDASVQLYTDYGLGLQRSAYGYSEVSGTSSYHWVPDETSKEITVDVYATIDDGDISYYGYALNYLGTSPTTCSSQAYLQGGGGATGVFNFYPYGYGYGVANSEGGSYADNSGGGVEATTDDSDAGQGSNDGWCGGELVVSGSVDDTYTGSPWGNSFSATASLNGMAYVQGQIVITNPQYYFGGFNAGAGYDVSGSGSIYLSGNIDDLE